MFLRFLIAVSDRLVHVSIRYKLGLNAHHLEWYLLDDNMCKIWDIVILEFLFALNLQGRKRGCDDLVRRACLGHVFFCKAWGGGTWLSKGWSGKLSVEWIRIAYVEFWICWKLWMLNEERWICCGYAEWNWVSWKLYARLLLKLGWSARQEDEYIYLLRSKIEEQRTRYPIPGKMK